jgi:hypothetical protein
MKITNSVKKCLRDARNLYGISVELRGHFRLFVRDVGTGEMIGTYDTSSLILSIGTESQKCSWEKIGLIARQMINGVPKQNRG